MHSVVFGNHKQTIFKFYIKSLQHLNVALLYMGPDLSTVYKYCTSTVHTVQVHPQVYDINDFWWRV